MKDPVPQEATKGDAFEDTMMLLEIVKEKRMTENKKLKVNIIFLSISKQ